MAEVVAFTEARVRSLRDAAAPGRRVEYVDSKVSALRLRVSASSASWYVFKRIPGGPMRRILLGSSDDLSVEGARKAAQRTIGQMLDGRDPGAEKRERRAQEERESLTLDQALAIYFEEKDLRPATRRTYERDLRTTFGDHWGRPLMELTAAKVRERHRQRKTRPVRAHARVESAAAAARIVASPSRADGAVRALRAVVRYVAVTRGIDLPDPATEITAVKQWSKVPRRKRALLGQRLRSFVSAVEALPDDLPPDLTGTQRDLVLLLLCTGYRLSTGAGLRWDEVDRREGVLTVEAGRMKGKRQHSIPVGPRMRALLEQRWAARRSDVFVFPGASGDAPIGRVSKHFMDKLTDEDGAPFVWSPHDLRRTASTLLEELDVSAYALKRILGHSEAGDVTAGYLADNVERLRAPMERLEQAALGSAGVVVPLQGRRRQ